MAEYVDKTITCVECGKSFVHSAGAQEFYAQKGFTSDPKRCPDCRRAKKEKQVAGARLRASTSENDALLGGGARAGTAAGAAASGGREMFTATCAECGTETQVPFKPRGDRPVYCRDCYQAKRGARP